MSRCKACDEILSDTDLDELCFRCVKAAKADWLPEDLYPDGLGEDEWESLGNGNYIKKPLTSEY